MMKRKSIFISLLIISALLLSGCQKTESTDEPATTTTTTGQLDVSQMFTDRDKEVGYDEETSTLIQLNGTSISCDSSNVSISKTTVTISKEGTYILTGTLENGSIVIDSNNSTKIQIVLNGVAITNESSAALYIKQADKVFITLAEGTENTLSTTKEFVSIDDNNIDGVIFSKDDLTLNGSGSLSIQSVYGHGIVCKDDLVVTGGTYSIEAAHQGLSGKDSIRIADGNFTIVSGTDSLHSENTDDESLGFVYIAQGTYSLKAQTDGISASYVTQIDGGTFDITTGNGSQNASTKNGKMNADWGRWGEGSTSSTTETTSAKGIKANSHLIINDGNFTIDSSDDALHSNANVVINKGTLTISSGDDGIHADAQTIINDGTLTVTKSYEGIEGQSIDITGGTIDVTTSDDGLNASGGNDQSSQGDRPGAGNFDTDSSAYIKITGGKITVDASGDGIDSNGNLYIDGGEIYVSGPSDSGNGSLDYNGEATNTGGIFVALGTSGMAQNFGNGSTQGSMLINLQSSQSANTNVQIKDSSGQVIVQYTAKKQFNSIVVSTPEIKTGETYTIITGSSETTITMSSLIYGNSNNNKPGNGNNNQPGGGPMTGKGR